MQYWIIIKVYHQFLNDPFHSENKTKFFFTLRLHILVKFLVDYVTLRGVVDDLSDLQDRDSGSKTGSRP
jgi:hypothetical protein